MFTDINNSTTKETSVEDDPQYLAEAIKYTNGLDCNYEPCLETTLE
ncbi:hypothetical protein J4455_04910 [Candidatus Woesearchaeota archaeon]|nr:hypothetical protein [Candidatus Woesearchaeota archaeon]